MVLELDKSRRAVLKRMKFVLAHIGGGIVTLFGKDFVKRLREIVPPKESSHGAKRFAHREFQLAMRQHFSKNGDNAFGGACPLHKHLEKSTCFRLPLDLARSRVEEHAV